MLRFQYDRTTGPRARFVLERARMRLILALAILTLAPIAAAQPTEPAPTELAQPPPDPQPAPADDPRIAELQAHLAALEQKLAAEPTPAEPTPAEPARDPAPPDDATGFHFGSYGRVIAGTDLRGGKPTPIHVVAHGPRIVEPSYLELDFAHGIRIAPSGLMRTVITLAFDDTLFHDTGEFAAGPAIRNLYVEAQVGKLRGWVGSRMLRGDDLYLLDFWPLDDLNTIGAGASVETGALEVAAHVGVNRLIDPFQYQEREVADPELGATTIVQLNRQRMIASARVGYLRSCPDMLSWCKRARLYAELHGLPAGERRRADATLEALPRDYGTTLGAELSMWENSADAGRVRQVNLFARWSKGLAAFDELAAPTSFDDQLETFPAASELVIGVGATYDQGGYQRDPARANTIQLMVAAYARRFVDADRNVEDRDDGWEYVLDARPAYEFGRTNVYASLDLGYEARFPRGLQPTTQAAADPAILSIAPMVTYSPAGVSAFSRPQLRAVYRAAHQNDGALALYPAADPRAIAWTHFLGVEAEWWFNSNSYR